MLHLKIAGTGRYLPAEIIPNNFFEGRKLNTYDKTGAVVDAKEVSEKDILRVTGIGERRKSASNECPSDMGYAAAVRAIEKSGIEVGSLAGIIFATVTEDKNFPSAACKIQEKLGARNCFAFDIANACAGFPEALASANSRVLRKLGNYLVAASECLTKMTDYTDLNSTLFSDGAGAAVLVPTEDNLGICAEYSVSDPFGGKLDYIFRDKDKILRMPAGRAVMREATRQMIEASSVLKMDAGWDRADVYIPHQANGRIIDEIEKRVKEEGSVVYRNIEKYGNMSAATCAVALDEAIEDGTICDGKRVIVVSFGAGLVTSGVAIQF